MAEEPRDQQATTTAVTTEHGAAPQRGAGASKPGRSRKGWIWTVALLALAGAAVDKKAGAS